MQFFFAFLPYISSFPVILRFFRPFLFQPYHSFPSNSGVANVPLVHTMMIPGVETQNAEFFRTLGMSLVADSNEAAARYADRIVYDGKTGAKLTEAQRKHMPADGAERIAAYITGRREL